MHFKQEVGFELPTFLRFLGFEPTNKIHFLGKLT